MTVRLNVLWAFLGLPFSLFTMLYYVYSYCRQKRVLLKDKVVFITGASSGLGAACAELFHEAGCKLVISGRQVDKLEELKEKLVHKQITGNPHVPAIVRLDLEDLNSIQSKIEEVISAFGHVDVLINNAGMSYRGEGASTKLEVHKVLMNVNYFGHIELTRALLPQMIKQKEGHIVAVSSVQGKLAIPHRTAYAASKHALQAYFDCLRPEVSQHNIHVSVISPYYIATDLSKNSLTGSGAKHGKMDRELKAGLSAEYVASKIVRCVTHRIDDLIVAPFHCHAAIAARIMAPWLLNIIMDFRAKSERRTMSKEK